MLFISYNILINNIYRLPYNLKELHALRRKEVDHNHKLHLHQRSLGTSRNFS